MKKYILFIAFFLIGCMLFSQKVQIKKGEISLDGNLVAKVEAKKGVYNYTTPEGEFKFSIKWRRIENDNNGFILIITDGDKSNQVKATGFKAMLSMEKIITESIIYGEPKLINSQGIDKEVLQSFLNSELVDLVQQEKIKKIWLR